MIISINQAVKQTPVLAVHLHMIMVDCDLETTHDHPDPGYNYPSGSNNGGLRREKITSQIRLIQVLTDQLTLIQGMVVNLNVK
jgi:hypothetical protein